MTRLRGFEASFALYRYRRRRRGRCSFIEKDQENRVDGDAGRERRERKKQEEGRKDREKTERRRRGRKTTDEKRHEYSPRQILQDLFQPGLFHPGFHDRDRPLVRCCCCRCRHAGFQRYVQVVIVGFPRRFIPRSIRWFRRC